MNGLLTAPGATRGILEKYGIHAKKKFGQNFLINAAIVDGIIEAAGITKEDCVLEIGPGIGTMSQRLSQEAGRLICVEIDESLRPILNDTLEGYDNITILWQDILKTDIRGLVDEYNEGRPLKVVANLPYYVTTPILMKLLEMKGCFESITVMVQKEVADRIRAQAGTKDYGAISLAVQYYAEPEVALEVPPHCFMPRPNVDSSVLHLKAYTEPPVRCDEPFMFALIRASFNQRRKTLSNGLTHGLNYEGRTLTREEVTQALDKMGLPPAVRGEKLTLEQFAELSELLK